jgi:hypothetical protein
LPSHCLLVFPPSSSFSSASAWLKLILASGSPPSTHLRPHPRPQLQPPRPSYPNSWWRRCRCSAPLSSADWQVMNGITASIATHEPFASAPSSSPQLPQVQCPRN